MVGPHGVVQNDPIAPIRAAVTGRYEILREIGQGAFATVYLARDLRHDRYVAFKILNADPSSETSELRFLREIRMLASLQHPNILPLIDSGHAEAMLYYVMPYITGESLRARITRERQLAIDAAITIACEVSDGLASAHEKGIIHRDIKPENILLSTNHAIVADFGIARAIDLAGVRQLTRTGIGSPGTPAYMSPEQLMGDKEVDRRTDIYSVGAVFYEMLTGKPPFVGKDGLVRRFTEPPPLPSALRAHLPEVLDKIVSRALARDPQQRQSTASELAEALGAALLVTRAQPASAPSVRAPDASQRGGSTVLTQTTPPSRERSSSSSQQLLPYSPAIDVPQAARREYIPEPGSFQPASRPASRMHLRAFAAPAMIIGALVAIGAAALAWSGARRVSAADGASLRRWEILLPDSASLSFMGAASGIGQPSIAISPDGSRLVYAGRGTPSAGLYYRELNSLVVTRLAGTDGAFNPFFSPDGEWIAFYANGYLKKISVPDGKLVTIARVKDPMGGDWGASGRILVADEQGTRPSLVPEAGGVLQPIQLQEKVVRRWLYPRLLPGGEWALHTDWDGSLAISSVRTGRAYGVTSEGVTPRDSTDVSKLFFGTNPMYVRSGHIVYLSGVGGVLMALPFDGERRRVLGAAAPVLEGVRQEAEAGAGQFTVSQDGTLVYAPGADAGVSKLIWLEPPAKVDTLPLPVAGYGSFDLSPDGTQILMRLKSQSGRAELWVFDLEKNSQTRIQTESTPLYVPQWWPDGKHILFSEFPPAGGLTAPVVRRTAETFSKQDTLVAAAIEVVPSPTGRALAASGWMNRPGMWLVPTDARSGKPVQIVPGPVYFMSFSPDGKWIVYGTPDPPEIYVSNTEHPEERHRISANGGEEPKWSARGDKIVYRSWNQFFSVAISTRDGFHASPPKLLFQGPYANVPGWSHAISPDGRRHLLLIGPPGETATRLVAVTNWFSELRRVAPAR
jgi:serine/threonine-protein kinase